MFAQDLGAGRENAVTSLGIEHLAVLDHSPFGEDNHLASAQDLGGEKGKQTGMVVGHGPDTEQEFGEAILRVPEKFGRGDAAAVGTGLAVDQILRNDRLETGEMVEQEDLAVLDPALILMQLDFYLEAVFQHRKDADAEIVIAGDFQIGALVHDRTLAACDAPPYLVNNLSIGTE